MNGIGATSLAERFSLPYFFCVTLTVICTYILQTGCLCMSCLLNFQKNEGPQLRKMMISALYVLMEGTSCAVTTVPELFMQVNVFYIVEFFYLLYFCVSF